MTVSGLISAIMNYGEIMELQGFSFFSCDIVRVEKVGRYIHICAANPNEDFDDYFNLDGTPIDQLTFEEEKEKVENDEQSRSEENDDIRDSEGKTSDT